MDRMDMIDRIRGPIWTNPSYRPVKLDKEFATESRGLAFVPVECVAQFPFGHGEEPDLHGRGNPSITRS